MHSQAPWIVQALTLCAGLDQSIDELALAARVAGGRAHINMFCIPHC